MKYSLSIIFLILILFTACTSQYSSTPAVNVQTENSPSVASIEPVLASATEMSEQKNLTPAPTTKPKGKKSTSTPNSTTPDFIAAEIASIPTATSVTMNVIPAVPMEIFYEYGTTPGEYPNQTMPQSAAAGISVETLISGLQPDTRYYYRLRYGNSAGQEHSFSTQRLPGSTFTFAIQGDSHPERLGKQFDADLYTRTLKSAASIQPDFFITMGDDFSVDQLDVVNPETVAALYIRQRQWLGLVDAPIFLVNGNHEQASLANLDGTPNNVAVWTQTSRNTYFPQPAPDSFYTGDTTPVEFIGLLRDYYAFTWGDALFVVIDPYWHSIQTVDNLFGAEHEQKKNRDLWNVTLGDEQYQWLKNTLESSTARYKFVFAHHVNGTGRGGIELANTYEWGDAANLNAHRPDWDQTIHQLMVENGVTIFFQGHDHIFARQELDGVIYQTLPEPANPNYSYENLDAFKSGDIFSNSGYVRAIVSPDGVQVDYIRTYLDRLDEIAFSYTVK